MINLERVSFAYGSVQVVRNVSLSVARGELFGILGPNGSGKSTLIKLISRVLIPGAGRIVLDGRELGRYRREEIARRIAVVPQETGIEMPFSVLEVVLMGRSPHLGGFIFESQHDLAVARRAMEQTGIQNLAARAFHELSGGEKQRVVLARALAQEPEILLLDEPTAFLDIKHQVGVYDLIKELNRTTGLTVVSILHDLNLAALYCDRLALLWEGSLACLGTPVEVLTYANIKEVYGTEVYIGLNDITGKVHIFPLDRESRERAKRQFSLHGSGFSLFGGRGKA